MAEFDLVVRGGLVITPAGRRQADVGIRGEQIAAVAPELRGRRTLDASGCYVIPGGVDQHVHLQMHLGGLTSSDSFASGTQAAALGGTTTVIDFVHTAPGASMLAALAARRAEADPTVAVDYALHMEIPTWHAAARERLHELPAVAAAGCATFKLYQAYPEVILDDPSLLRALQAVAQVGGFAVLHAEVGPVIDLLRAAALEAGRTAPIEHERTRPPALEATAVQRAAALAQLAGCPLLIFHVGNAPTVAAIAALRAAGVQLWGESCPQYLVLNSEQHLGGADGNLYICAPPLRPVAHQTALWQALAAGDLQVVSTDHCPWTRAEKAQSAFAQIPGGVPSIEARLALVHHFGVNAGHLSLERWVELCCANPAQLMRLEQKGRLEVGCDADVVVFDPATERTISQAPGRRTLHEAADWTPYEGMHVRGWTRDVLLRGTPIVLDGAFCGAAGAGRFIARRTAGGGAAVSRASGQAGGFSTFPSDAQGDLRRIV